jgi:hypothetical protein
MSAEEQLPSIEIEGLGEHLLAADQGLEGGGRIARQEQPLVRADGHDLGVGGMDRQAVELALQAAGFGALPLEAVIRELR